jgi:DNA-binding winged helix-turn-helix (wHTH) protein/tetratricopeptide (TPR) repeat protein
MRAPSQIVYEFGGFRLDARRRLLLARPDGRIVALTAKAFDTLLYLVEHAGEVVEKAELLRAVWPNVRVEENSVSQCVSALRRVLGEDPSEHRFIVTAPGRGYRFIAGVRAVQSEGPHLASSGESMPHPGRRAGVRALAVLPFKPLSAADRLESLELGMTDALIMRIGGLRDLEVRPLSSVRRYGGLEQDPLEAGRALQVDCVLDGSLQRNSERIRVSVRLIEVSTGRQLWAARFDQDFVDIFDIQDAIAERAAGALVNELTSVERHRLRRHPTQDAHAYQLYVTGWSGLTRPSCSSLEQALGYLEQAVARDPEFALAYACLADCYAVFSVFGGGAPHDLFPKARAAVVRALEIDPDLPTAHAELGHIRQVYDLDFEGAEQAYRRALQLDPDSTMAHHYMGLLLIARGELDEALQSIRRAQALEPLALNFNANIGMTHYYARRYREAARQLETTLRMDGGFDHARSYLGRAYLRVGEFERAIEEFQRRTSVTIGSVADLPAAYALAGRRNDAVEELERLLGAPKDRYVSAFDIATIYAALNAPEDVLKWLDIAIEQRAQPIMFLAVDPAFDALRADPRFARLLGRLAAV